MVESTTALTPLHYACLIGAVIIPAVMVMRRDTPAVCIAFLFILGLIDLRSITGGIMTVFDAILYAGKEFMEALTTIALVTSLSKCLKDLGGSYLMMVPMSRIMKTPSITWWILGLTMLVFSLFLWPSPSVALVGAIMPPFAIKAGPNPLAVAMTMNLFDHEFTSSHDFIIRGAPAVSAGAAGITTIGILHQAQPMFWIMGIVTVGSVYLLDREEMEGKGLRPSIQAESTDPPWNRRATVVMVVVTPLVFVRDILLMLAFQLKGNNVTSMVSGIALILMCLGALLSFGKQSLEEVTGYVMDGFLLAIRIFTPVVIIGAYLFLGKEGIAAIMDQGSSHRIMNDRTMQLTQNAPLNKYVTALIQMAVGNLTGLGGSGLFGLPLIDSLARTFDFTTGASVPVMAALGQIIAIFVGGGTIIPWGLIPVTAICNVSPLDLARKNLALVYLGFLYTFIAACFLL